MGIFRRGNSNTTDELDPSNIVTDREDSPGEDIGGDVKDGLGSGGGSDDAPGRSGADEVTSTAVSRRNGPFDRTEVEGLEGRLDLGSLWLTGVAGMELRLEVEEETQNVVGATAVLGESAVQLQAFAAPRTEGIWDDIRDEIAVSITDQGGTADKVSGPLGVELRAQMPGQGPDGRMVLAPVRFVGVDGPRWFLRAVLSGPAAVDAGAASTLLDVVRATVIVRGDEAMAPRELLPLKLPEQAESADGMAESSPEESIVSGGPSLDELKPFERGPEITEIH